MGWSDKTGAIEKVNAGPVVSALRMAAFNIFYVRNQREMLIPVPER